MACVVRVFVGFSIGSNARDRLSIYGYQVCSSKIARRIVVCAPAWLRGEYLLCVVYVSFLLCKWVRLLMHKPRIHNTYLIITPTYKLDSSTQIHS